MIEELDEVALLEVVGGTGGTIDPSDPSPWDWLKQGRKEFPDGQ